MSIYGADGLMAVQQTVNLPSLADIAGSIPACSTSVARKQERVAIKAFQPPVLE